MRIHSLESLSTTWRESRRQFLSKARKAALIALLFVLGFGASACANAAVAATLDVQAIAHPAAYRAMSTQTIRVPGLAGSFSQTMSVEAVAPDRAHVVTTIRAGELTSTSEVITVGGTLWIRTNGGFWSSRPLPAIDPSAIAALSESLCTTVKGFSRSLDHVDGEETVHYSSKGRSTDQLTASLQSVVGSLTSALSQSTGSAADLAGQLTVHISSFDLWTTTSGRQPVKMTMKLDLNVAGQKATSETTVAYSDYGSADITINPPK